MAAMGYDISLANPVVAICPFRCRKQFISLNHCNNLYTLKRHLKAMHLTSSSEELEDKLIGFINDILKRPKTAASEISSLDLPDTHIQKPSEDDKATKRYGVLDLDPKSYCQ